MPPEKVQKTDRDSDREPGETGRPLGRMRQFLITLVILAFIGWLTLFLALRTPVGKNVVEGRLADYLGIPCRIGTLSLGFPLTLTMRDITTDASTAESAALTAELIRLSLVTASGIKIDCLRPVLTLQQAHSGEWVPGPLGRLGLNNPLDPEAVSRVSQDWPKTLRVSVSDGMLALHMPDGQLRAELHGVDFVSSPVKIPGSVMRYQRLRIAGRLIGGRMEKQSCEFEWFSSRDFSYLAIPAPPDASTDEQSGDWE